jgi:aspartate/methionine/tyrosine aminotransferase
MEDKISDIVRQIGPSVIRDMSLKAAKYDRVISLGIGEPDFHTDQTVCRRALQDALAGATHYTPSRGDPELLSVLQDHLLQHYGYRLSETNLLVTGGGMGALTGYFRTVLSPGDEVLVPEPHFPAYRPQVQLAGGQVVLVPTRFEDGFELTVEAVEKALTSRSKVLLLNSPNNPTGAMIPGPTLDQLAELVRERELLVISDEVYDRLTYDGRRHESIYTRPGMEDCTVVVNSFSKSFAMTGWRLGYAFGPEWLMDEMMRVVMFYTSCPPSVSQRAALAALQLDPSKSDAMVEAFRQRRALIYEALMGIPGVRVHKPSGAFYIFPSVQEITDNTERFALDLLDQEQVVVVPGTAFGPSGAHCIRMAFTVDHRRLAEAMTRFARFVRRITG